MSHDGRNTLTAEGYALLNGLLQLDPSRRMTADKALKHPWCVLLLASHLLALGSDRGVALVVCSVRLFSCCCLHPQGFLWAAMFTLYFA